MSLYLFTKQILKKLNVIHTIIQISDHLQTIIYIMIALIKLLTNNLKFYCWSSQIGYIKYKRRVDLIEMHVAIWTSFITTFNLTYLNIIFINLESLNI